MARRTLDIAVAASILILSGPLLAIVAIAIGLASPGPILFRTSRVGLRGRPFTMLKLRTMHVGSEAAGSVITAAGDPRVYPLGSFLRRTKIDELPQLLNVLGGDMSIVGPRPEAPAIVERAYRPEHMETLETRPGLTSPGSLFYYARGEALLEGGAHESLYIERLLPVKLALDTVYVRRSGVGYDLALMWRTAVVILSIVAGRGGLPDPPEMGSALAILSGWNDS